MAAISMIVFPIQPPLFGGGLSETPTVTFTVYGGEINQTRFGFGFSSSNLTSPGPVLSFNLSDVVKVTFFNVGQYAHGFEVTNAPSSGATVLFSAAVGSASSPLSPGQSGSITFKADKTGSFFYICPVPGHAELGMWGNVTVT